MSIYKVEIWLDDKSDFTVEVIHYSNFFVDVLYYCNGKLECIGFDILQPIGVLEGFSKIGEL